MTIRVFIEMSDGRIVETTLEKIEGSGPSSSQPFRDVIRAMRDLGGAAREAGGRMGFADSEFFTGSAFDEEGRFRFQGDGRPRDHARRTRARGPGSSTPYEILGVTPGAPMDEVKAAWRRLVREHHPDRGGDRERFELVQLAYDAIRRRRR